MTKHHAPIVGRSLAACLLSLCAVVMVARADVSGWSDDAWDAARRGDVAAFEEIGRAHV